MQITKLAEKHMVEMLSSEQATERVECKVVHEIIRQNCYTQVELAKYSADVAKEL